VPQIIRDGRLVDDEWVLQEPDNLVEHQEHIILPLSSWIASRGKVEADADVGVWLDSDEDPHMIASDVATLPLIALNFPTYTDGRPYSSANILRRMYDFRGELRAIGDVRRDQMEQMHRCGFNAFQLTEGQTPETSLAAFKLFSHSYQSSIDRPEPLFRIRKN